MAKKPKLVASLFFHPGSVQPAPGARQLPARTPLPGLLPEEEAVPAQGCCSFCVSLISGGE